MSVDVGVPTVARVRPLYTENLRSPSRQIRMRRCRPCRNKPNAWIVAILSLMLAACTAQKPAADPRETARIALGQKLFEDKSLSVGGKVSCATCHNPARAFTDARPRSVGVQGLSGTRNAPSLLDVKLMSSFFWEGRIARLEEAAIQALTNPVEMGAQSRDPLLLKINRHADYRKATMAAFATERLDSETLGIALAAYLRALPSGESRYERYVRSGRKTGLTAEETEGLVLFQGKAGCAACHVTAGATASFTDNAFHHTGVGFERVAGNLGATLERLDRAQRNGAPIGELLLSQPDIAELGRFVVTRRPSDLGAFRTPTLRNVAATAPYMHDGSVPTLEAAVEREIYYRSLAKGQPITLTVEEQKQLMAFLRSLSVPAQNKSDAPLASGVR